MKFRQGRIAAAFAVVFAAGVVTGSAGMHLMLRRGLAKALDAKEWSATVMRELQSRLHLAPGQHDRIQAMLDESSGEFKGLFTRTFEDCGRAILKLQARIDAELDPDQRRIHEAMKEEFRRRLKEDFNATLPEK